MRIGLSTDYYGLGLLHFILGCDDMNKWARVGLIMLLDCSTRPTLCIIKMLLSEFFRYNIIDNN